jgi:hypothetical protein
MDTPISTEYPKLQVAGPTRTSLANLPLEMVLEILDALFKPEQLIVIDVYGHKEKHETISDREHCTAILRAPPLNATAAAACRLFRHMYRKSRPTLWGAHLHLGRAYHVDLARDIFHVRVHPSRPVPNFHRIRFERLDGILNGVQRVATSLNYTCLVGWKWFLGLKSTDSPAKELIVLVPVPGLENNSDLELSPVLVPLRAEDRIDGLMDAVTWPEYKIETNWYLYWPWRFAPAEMRPKLELWGYLVDERRLNDPIASGWDRFQPAGGPDEDFSLLRVSL